MAIEHLSDTHMPASDTIAGDLYADHLTATDNQTQRTLLANVSSHASMLAGLEEAARVAIDTVVTEAEHRLSQAIDQAENHVIESISLSEQQQKELARWRDEVDDRLRIQLREIGEWDEILSEKRTEIDGLREMAEASLSLASGDLDKRWERLQRELRDILNTFEVDERARWEAFMASVSTGEGNNIAVLDVLRAEVAQMYETTQQSVQQQINAVQQPANRYREQLASLRTELRTLIASENERLLAETKAQITTQMTQGNSVSADDVQQLLMSNAQTLHNDILAVTNDQQSELTSLRTTITELSTQMEYQAKLVAGNEGLRREVQRLRRRTQTWHTVTFIFTFLALLAGVGSIIIHVLHLI
jgi:predicted DNA-binding protein YlxM (UPF0122 family)